MMCLVDSLSLITPIINILKLIDALRATALNKQ